MEGEGQLDDLQYRTACVSDTVSELLSQSGQRDQELESLSTLLRDIKRMQGGASEVGGRGWRPGWSVPRGPCIERMAALPERAHAMPPPG